MADPQRSVIEAVLRLQHAFQENDLGPVALSVTREGLFALKQLFRDDAPVINTQALPSQIAGMPILTWDGKPAPCPPILSSLYGPDHPDRLIDCQVAAEPAFQQLADEMVEAGWTREEVAEALIELAVNHKRGMAEGSGD